MHNAAIYYKTTDFQLPLRFHKCALTVMLTVKGQLLKSSWISHKIIIIVLATLTIENVRHVQGSIQASSEGSSHLKPHISPNFPPGRPHESFGTLERSLENMRKVSALISIVHCIAHKNKNLQCGAQLSPLNGGYICSSARSPAVKPRKSTSRWTRDSCSEIEVFC